MVKKILLLILLAGFLAAGVVGWKVYQARPWLPILLLEQFFQREPADQARGPVDLIFVFVDHYEPHHIAAIERWEKMYRRVAGRHRDADGKMPQHTFFWYWSDEGDQKGIEYLNRLAHLSYDGYGEVELHLHHDDDTEETVRVELDRRIRLSQQTGAFLTAERQPKTAYAFIHGMWALDNSRGGRFCGVNRELEVLRESGCYADFTHSSWGTMNPKIANTLYYAKDDPNPKSYDMGRKVEVAGEPWGDLLIFMGPSVLSFENGRFYYDHGDVTMEELPTPERIRRWVRTAIHVQGRPEWIFVKVFTHGTIARDHEALLGKWADRMYWTLETQYNDGKRYRLHYASAREAYNILKAAEAGYSGNPNDFRDFAIVPYANQKILASVPYELVTYSPERVELIPDGGEGNFRFKEGAVEEIRGDFSRIVIVGPFDAEPDLRFEGEGRAWVKLRHRTEPFQVVLESGPEATASVVENHP